MRMSEGRMWAGGVCKACGNSTLACRCPSASPRAVDEVFSRQRVTRDQIAGWRRWETSRPSYGQMRALCDLALRALELDEVYGHELRVVDLRAILKK
jgi:hypothetical protein